MESNRPTTCRIITLLPCGVICIFLAALLPNIDIIQIIVNYNCQITNGSGISYLLQQKSPAIHISAYLFNVTNAEQFLMGEDNKLRVEEVGPFTYREIRSNQDLEIDEEAEVMRYSPKSVLEFLPEESVADPKDVNVTLPNLAVLGMSSMMSSQGYLTKLAFGVLLQQLRSKMIVNQTAEKFLWGYDEPLIRLGNTILPGWINFEKIGLLDRIFDPKRPYRLELHTSLHKKFKIKAMNGLGGLKDWDYEDSNKRTKCNTFTDAYEGIGYPSNMPPGAPVRIFRNLLCRFLDLEYQGQVTALGAKAFHYKISPDNFNISNDTECLCGRGTCISGISDISPCYYNLPLALSNAHFLDGDPKLLERIDGLAPSEEKHGSEILIEPKIGMALTTNFAVQVNIVMNTVDFSAEASRFSDMVVPLCYLKLVQPELNEYSTRNLRLTYVIAPKIILTVVIVFYLAGIVMVAYALHLIIPRLGYSKRKGIIFRRSSEKPAPNAAPLLSGHYLMENKEI